MTYSQQPTLPNFFYNEEKKIMFCYGNKNYNFSTIRTGVHDDTLAKSLEGGLNHFLMFFFLKDPVVYNDICLHILETFFHMYNESKEKLKADDENYMKNRNELIRKYLVLDSILINYICEYVKATSNLDDVEENTETAITLQNIHCNIIHIISVCITFTFVYSPLIIGNMKYDVALEKYLDILIQNVFNEAKYFYPEELSDEEKITEIKNDIDRFLFQRVTYLWDTNSDASFRAKFEEEGKDNLYYILKNKVAVYSSLKKYFPQLDPQDLAPKYSDGDTKISDIYYTVEKDFHDFKFVNKNLASYIQNTLKNIITNQDTASPTLQSNKPDYISDSTDERSTRKDTLLYEDKTKYYFDLIRRKTAIDLFSKFIKEINDFSNEHNITDLRFCKNIKLNKKHYFNQFVLSKILLCLTGECRIYTMVYGSFSVYILLLFYLKVKYEPELAWLAESIDIMMHEPINISNYTLDTLETYLNDEGYDHINPNTFEKICRLYVDDNNVSRLLSKEQLLDLYDFLSDPARVRNLLFPELYPEEDDVVLDTVSEYDKNYFENLKLVTLGRK